MRVAHVITRFVRGGADENTLLSCNAQAAGGAEVHLIYGREFSEALIQRLHPQVRRHCVETLVRPIDPLNDVRAFLELRDIFRRTSPDVVHTHTSKAGVLGRMAAIANRCPAVIHGVHILPFVNVSPLQRAIYLGLEKALAPATHAFVNVSEGMRDLGVANGVGREDRHFVVPSGMPVALFQSAKPFSDVELAERISSGAVGAPLLVFVAALEARKRQYEFFEVFRRVRQQAVNARLVLLGEGVDERRLRQRADALGLSDAVDFIGYTSEVERWIASAAVCVFASEREGLPRAVIQYAIGGRPVVSTDLPGIEAVVKQGKSGFLVPVNDLLAMVDPIVRLIDDRRLANEMADYARSLDLSAWDEAAMARSLMGIYTDVLAVRAA